MNIENAGKQKIEPASATSKEPKSYSVAVIGGGDLDRVPRVAKFLITEESAREIIRLAALASANNLHQVERFGPFPEFMQYDPETDPSDAEEAGEENDVRTECDVLAITKEDFFFHAYVKHTDVRVESEAQSIADLAVHFGIPLADSESKPSAS